MDKSKHNNDKKTSNLKHKSMYKSEHNNSTNIAKSTESTEINGKKGTKVSKKNESLENSNGVVKNEKGTTRKQLVKYAFWYFDEKGFLKIDYSHRLLEFLGHKGFRIIIGNGEDVKLIQVKDNIISEVKVIHIKRFIQDYIKSLPFKIPTEIYGTDSEEKVIKDAYRDAILSKVIKGNQQYLNKSILEFLPEFKDDILEHTESEMYFLYKNCFVEISAKGYKAKPYKELPKYAWQHTILDRNFEKVEASKLQGYENNREGKPNQNHYNFIDFLFKISNQDQQRFDSLMSVIGYQLHNFFGYSLKAVCFTDSKIEDGNEANGRSGKSLIGQAISQMLNTPENQKISVTIDGKAFDTGYNHRFDKCEENTMQIHINDLDMKSGKFDFEALYPSITEGVEVNKKRGKFYNTKSKILLSSNQVILGNGESHKDRLLEFEVSEFFNSKNKVNEFYNDWFWSRLWTAKQWQFFDNIMMTCCQCFLTLGKMKKVESINLEERKFTQSTCQEFVEFVRSSIRFGEKIDKQVLKNQFEDIYTDFRSHKNKWFNMKKFMQWCRAGANLGKYKIIESRSHNDFYIEFIENKK